MATPSPAGSSSSPATSSRSAKAPCTRRCTASRRATGSRPSGGFQTTTAAPSSTSSRRWAAASSATKPNPGVCWSKQWARSCKPASSPSDLMTTWRTQLRFWRSDIREDVDAELGFHFEMRVRDLVAAGWTPAAAREEAERRFGELAAVRDACIAIDQRRRERVRRREVWRDMFQDFRFALRTLLKSPAFTLMAVLCVGLGVGVTSTILSAVNAILIRPLPYQKPGELAAVYAWLPKTDEHRVNISHPDYVSWRDDNKSFAQLGMYTWQAYAFSGDGEPERVDGAMVTANLFPLLGVSPLLGHGFVPEEEQPN